MDLTAFVHDYDLDHLVMITAKNQDFQMWVTPRFQDRYEHSCYEEYTSSLVSAFAKRVGLFIDVGAHYGYFSLLVCNSNPACDVIAFEPVPENFEILNRNLELNHYENATAINKAVSNQEGQMRFNICAASDNCGFIEHPDAPRLRELEVDAITLKSILDENPEIPILIKIDTEGHEIEVLQGIQPTLQDRDDIRLIVEYDPRCLREAGHQPQDLIKFLAALQYEVFLVDDSSMRCYRALHGDNENRMHQLMKDESANLLCIKNNRSLGVVFFSHSAELHGSERSLLELVTGLIHDYGAICSVYLPQSGPLVDRLKKVGAAIIVAEYAWWCGTESVADPEIIQNRFDQSFRIVLDQATELARIGPDVICTSTLTLPWGAVSAALINRPHLWMVNEFGELDHGLRFYLPFSEVRRFIVDSSNQIVTCSKAVQDGLFKPLGAENAETIYNYIALPEEATKESGEEFFFVPGAFRVVIYGRISESKGQEDAILAAVELIKERARNVELVLVGNGHPVYLRYLRQIVADARLEDRIRFLPFQENVFPIINQADAVLVCSRNEAFGRVTLEAMLMKKAVIGSNSGGTIELIHDGETGLLYDPGNSHRLADQIERLIDLPELRSDLGQNALEYASTSFTKARFAGRYYDLLVGLKRSVNTSSGRILQLINQWFMFRLMQKDREMGAEKARVAKSDQEIQTLAAQLADKDHQVRAAAAEAEALSQRSEEKEQQVQALATELAERNEQFDTLSEEVARREQELRDLSTELAGKVQEVQVLNEKIAQNEQEAKESSRQLTKKKEKERLLRSQLKDLTKNVDSLNAQMAEREKSIERFKRQVAKRDQELVKLQVQREEATRGLDSLSRQLADSQNALQTLEDRISEITGSTAWGIIRMLWRIRLWIAPHSSLRERILRLAIRGPRIWRREGPKTPVAGSRKEVSDPVGVPTSSDIEGSPSDQQIRNLNEIIRSRFSSLQPLSAVSMPGSRQRLNIVTDSINAGSLFGGVATSLIFSALLAERWKCSLRIITRTAEALKHNFLHILELNEIPWKRNVEFSFLPVSDPAAELPVTDNEVFLTTSWWTTRSVRDAFREERIIYLLQEDERSFYPFGDDYLRCTEILRSPGIKFVVNSELLYNHLVAEGFENIRSNGLWFEPSFPKKVFFYERDKAGRKRNFLFYARPSNLRNLFYMGLEVIDTAISRGILDLDEWDFSFVGKDIPDLRIGPSIIPRLIQNVSWAEYATVIRKMDLGLCLMYSPHPSYPPLDLASSGAVVVTNKYGNKQNLDAYSKNILCQDLDINCLVQGIEEAVRLVSDSERRIANYQENRILHDWSESFEDVLRSLDDWPPIVRR